MHVWTRDCGLLLGWVCRDVLGPLTLFLNTAGWGRVSQAEGAFAAKEQSEIL